ncbi:sigma-54 dependent transcriptional regulator [Dokdonella sp.]|uniref:sigma-54-dependent transcriptional regulator n=1 Tax=Dokdonella sp. TaxID=2291710 RepID=UPI002F3E7F5A
MDRLNDAARVLVVDDNEAFRAIVAEVAQLEGCHLTNAATLADARRCVEEARFDLLLVDLSLPDGNGLDLVDEIDLAEHGRIAIATGFPSIESAVRAVRKPVVEYLVKPVPFDALARLMRDACERAAARPPRAAAAVAGMVGQSAPMRALFDQIRRVAPLDVGVFVHGESGTGKELVARALHELSARSGRFIAVNCGAIAPDLLSSQLFGHERGSFTGAAQAHAGFFEQAQGGTLFLDEVTEMPLALQVYLLRVIETRTLTRVGGAREVPVDVRIVAASNRDPQLAVANGHLRADLYYRLSEFPLTIPPLRARRDDIPMLARHFLDRLNQRYGTARAFDADGLRRLAERAWPGNVRELRHAVQRAYILADHDIVAIAEDAAPRAIAESDGSIRFSVGMSFDDIEREMLLKTLAASSNNKRRAARALGITTKTIYNRLLRYREQGLIGDELVGSGPDDDKAD